VGLIASIRLVLVISLQMTTLTKEGRWSADGSSIFRVSMIELALLVVLVLVLVFSITLLRRYAPAPKDLMESLHSVFAPSGKAAVMPLPKSVCAAGKIGECSKIRGRVAEGEAGLPT
jgi:hypothetical protein